MTGVLKGNYIMSRVFVLDQKKKPLMPCSPARARLLLTQKKAAVILRFPFTIILKDRIGGNLQEIEIKFDLRIKQIYLQRLYQK